MQPTAARRVCKKARKHAEIWIKRWGETVTNEQEDVPRRCGGWRCLPGASEEGRGGAGGTRVRHSSCGCRCLWKCNCLLCWALKPLQVPSQKAWNSLCPTSPSLTLSQRGLNSNRKINVGITALGLALTTCFHAWGRWTKSAYGRLHNLNKHIEFILPQWCQTLSHSQKSCYRTKSAIAKHPQVIQNLYDGHSSVEEYSGRSWMRVVHSYITYISVCCKHYNRSKDISCQLAHHTLLHYHF